MHGSKHGTGKRICFVITTLHVGGAQKHLDDVLPRLRKNGFLPTVFTIGAKEDYAFSLEDNGIPIIESWIARTPFASFAPVRFIGAVLHLTALLLRTRPLILHAMLPEASLVGSVSAFLTRQKLRIVSRRSLRDYQRGRRWLRTVEGLIFRNCSAVLGNARAVVDQVIAEGAPSERTRLIYNGVDINEFANRETVRAAVRAALKVRDDTLILITVANLIPYKGHADLLRAIAKASGQLGANWLLLCVGRDDGIRSSLETLASELEISGQVRWLGQRADVPGLLLAADIGLLVSHQEGFSNVLLEGLAASLPFVATEVGGNPEVIDDGKTGFLVPPQAVDSIAGAIARLASSPELARQMGMRGRQTVEDKFTIEECVEQYEQLYRELLAAR